MAAPVSSTTSLAPVPNCANGSTNDNKMAEQEQIQIGIIDGRYVYSAGRVAASSAKYINLGDGIPEGSLISYEGDMRNVLNPLGVAWREGEKIQRLRLAFVIRGEWNLYQLSDVSEVNGMACDLMAANKITVIDRIAMIAHLLFSFPAEKRLANGDTETVTAFVEEFMATRKKTPYKDPGVLFSGPAHLSSEEIRRQALCSNVQSEVVVKPEASSPPAAGAAAAAGAGAGAKASAS